MGNELLTPARGRPPVRSLHAEQVRKAESKIADRLPELVDSLLEMAAERKPERCRTHIGSILDCPVCHEPSKGAPSNQSAMVYLINRIMGQPTVAAEARINLDFVQRLAKGVAEAFNEVNILDDPAARREQFAMRIAELWVMVGETA